MSVVAADTPTTARPGFPGALRRGITGFARFSGRTAPGDYWRFIAIIFAGAVVVRLGDMFLFSTPPQLAEPRMAMQSPTRPLSLAWFVLTLLPLCAATVRRLHDSGRSAWHLWMPVGLSLLATIAIVLGVSNSRLLEPWLLDELHWRGSAAGASLLALIALAFLQITLVLLMLWYLTTPSEPRENRYGPPPPGAA